VDLCVNYAHLYAVRKILSERKLNTERKVKMLTPKEMQKNLWHSIEYIPIYIHKYFLNII